MNEDEFVRGFKAMSREKLQRTLTEEAAALQDDPGLSITFVRALARGELSRLARVHHQIGQCMAAPAQRTFEKETDEGRVCPQARGVWHGSG